jgi:predicted Zn-dependent protease
MESILQFLVNKEMKKIALIFGLLVLTLSSCATSKNGGGFNLFTIADDKKFGAEVATEIESDPTKYKILDSSKNVAVYKYIYKVRDNILNSGQVEHKSDFQWRIRIIHDDSTLNAFCTPGGYIYVYTGILKFLESEDEFAGVLAHEIAHADKRHSTRQMTQMFGVQMMLQIVAGNRELVKQVSGALIGLKFSRNHETEADLHSVKYLCPTAYNAAGGAGFFEKIQAVGGGRTPEFLSTHPDPGNRIQNFQTNKEANECKGSSRFVDEYRSMVALLPK